MINDEKAALKAGIITQKSPSERLIGQPDGPTWSAPYTPELKGWVKAQIDAIESRLPELKVAEVPPTTGLCEKQVVQTVDGVDWRFICTMAADHDGDCIPLGTQGASVLEEPEPEPTPDWTAAEAS